jgi:hypothetical protein
MIVGGPRPTYIEPMKHAGTWGRGRAVAMLTAGALLVGGCGGGGTSPDPGEPPTILFTPAVQGQQLSIGQNLDFRAGVTPDGALSVTWRRGGAIVSTVRDYAYTASQVGRDTLRVHAEAGESVRDYFWVIDVSAEPRTEPPAVPSFALFPGDDPVEVSLSWTRVSVSTYPIVEYVVAVSYTGVVTAANWDQATILGTVTHVPGQVGYNATYDRANGGLVPGAEAWFAIRARDDRGQLSSTVSTRFTTITTEWWIDGHVFDVTGQPLLGVIVSTGNPLRNDNTDGDGIFRLGPYRSIDSVAVYTTTIDYYDFTTARLRSSVDVDLDLVLPYRFGIADECTGYDADFLTFFREMTNTESSEADTSASRLWKWDHWPVSVHLPDSTLANGRQLDDLARAMVDLWNQSLGEVLLVEVATEAAADVHFEWVTNSSGGYGVAVLEQPAGAVMGDVIPQRIRVEVETGLFTPQFFQEVALHELGHVLGMVDHSLFCNQAGHLMVLGASGNLSLAQPIHPDEIHVVRTLRRLPQGVDMRRFEP